MRIGSRIVQPAEVDRWDLEIAQISVYRGFGGSLDIMRECAEACIRQGLSYVLHPVSYSLLDPEARSILGEMAEWAGEGLILHDERTGDGERLTGEDAETVRKALADLTALVPVSFENATHTADVSWFWSAYATSVTLDMGHMESAGLDSVDFVKNLDQATLRKVQYVHMHRNHQYRRGLTDHWFLTPDCREMAALEALLKRKKAVDVILEINEIDMIEDSLSILRALRDTLQH